MTSEASHEVGGQLGKESREREEGGAPLAVPTMLTGGRGSVAHTRDKIARSKRCEPHPLCRAV